MTYMRSLPFRLSALLFAASLSLRAATPPAAKLLPQDTLVVITAPDLAQAQAAFAQSPAQQLWLDPAMQPFKDKLVAKFKEAVVTPLEQQFGVHFEDYAGLAKGQVTLAVIQNGWDGKTGQLPAWVLVLDSKDNSDLLKKRLGELKQKWTTAGQAMKPERIRDLDFTTLMFSGDQTAATVRKALNGAKAEKDAAEEDKKDGPKISVTLGQSDSLLLIGNDPQVIEKILVRQSGGLAPALAELPAYEANAQAVLRDALVCGWVNIKAFVEIANRTITSAAAKNQQQNPLSLQPDKLLAASGLTGVQTAAYKLTMGPEGTFVHLFLGAPASQRTGVIKMLETETKDASPPPFVTADVVKFSRWRMDGQKAWANLEAMINDVSPQLGGILQMSLSAVGKDKDPNFDFKKNLIGNLGDDFISFDRPPRSGKLADLNSPPSLFLLGSPRPDQLTLALKAGTALMPAPDGGSAVKDREFLGKKIYSVTLPNPPGQAAAGERSFSFAATASYVAMSADATLLEEYLRSGDKAAKGLSDVPGLSDAAQKVGGMSAGFFGYQNYADVMRTALEILKSDPDALSKLYSSPLLAAQGGPDLGAKGIKDWLDFSLLPSYDKLAKYFNYSVYAGGSTPDGFEVKLFSARPPELK